MVPEGPSEGAASSAPASVSEASPPAAVEAAEGTDDAAAVGAPLTNWADISEVEASALYPAVTGEPEDLLDFQEAPTTPFGQCFTQKNILLNNDVCGIKRFRLYFHEC